MCVCSHVCVWHSVLKRCMSLRTLPRSARCSNTLYRCTFGESRTTSGVTWKTRAWCTVLSQSEHTPHSAELQALYCCESRGSHSSCCRASGTVLLQKPRFHFRTQRLAAYTMAAPGAKEIFQVFQYTFFTYSVIEQFFPLLLRAPTG